MLETVTQCSQSVLALMLMGSFEALSACVCVCAVFRVSGHHPLSVIVSVFYLISPK